MGSSATRRCLSGWSRTWGGCCSVTPRCAGRGRGRCTRCMLVEVDADVCTFGSTHTHMVQPRPFVAPPSSPSPSLYPPTPPPPTHPQAFTYAIERSCVNKAEVVAADEREGGLRATLNLGHTFGHAIETCSGYGVWLHGEAVAAGTMMAADMSHRLGWIDAALLQRIRALNEKAHLPVAPPPVRGVGGRAGGRMGGLHSGGICVPSSSLPPRCFLLILLLPLPPAPAAEHDGGPVPGDNGSGQEGAGWQAAPHPAQVSALGARGPAEACSSLAQACISLLHYAV